MDQPPTNETRHHQSGRADVMSFATSAAAPLSARFILRFVRRAAMTRMGRVIGVMIGLLVAAYLLVPAAFAWVLVRLATGDAQAASNGFVIVFSISLAVLLLTALRLWLRWKSFRRQHLGY